MTSAGSSYMRTPFAQTLDQKSQPNANLQMGSHLQGNASATQLHNYAVPSVIEGKLIPAVPIKLALKMTPPTLAVVYQIKDGKSEKKYIHNIRIDFEKEESNGEIDIDRMCEEYCRKETTYLNPAFINRQQVKQLLRKLHQSYLKKKEPNGNPDEGLKKSEQDKADNNNDFKKDRKPNFFEKKRWLNYEQNQNNSDSEDDKNKTDNKKDKEASKEKDVAQLKEQPAQPAATTEIFEEEIVSMPAAKKNKPEAVRSAAPPKTKKEDKNVEELKLDDQQKSKDKDKDQTKKSQPLKEKSESDYSDDDWGNADYGLEDAGDRKQADNKNGKDLNNGQKGFEVPNLNDDFFNNVKEDPILNKQTENLKQEDSNDILFQNEFDDLDLDFNNDDKKNNGFGQSQINKDLLRQTNKDIEKDGLFDDVDDQFGSLNDNDANQVKKGGLQIEIDENANIAEVDDKAQQMLLENVMKNENKMAEVDGMVPGAQQMDDDDEDEEPYTEEGIIQQFDEIYNADPALQQLLGEQTNSYSVEEKISIIQAYKKGGGVQGLAEIIDDEDEEEGQPGAMGGLPADFDPNTDQLPDGLQYAEQEEQDDEDVDIDLENPEDVKIIESEFQKLYDNEEKFKNDFGEEMFELSPLQKYQIIDAYNKNGMDAVMALLNNSVDQSQNASAMMQQLDMHGGLDAEESIIEHQGKRYQRIQIEGLRDNDDEYLMDEQQNIYSLDFKFITNMGDHQIEADDDDE